MTIRPEIMEMEETIAELDKRHKIAFKHVTDAYREVVIIGELLEGLKAEHVRIKRKT